MVVVATGFFDGVHLGHRQIIDTLVRTARERGGRSVLISFWPHPRTVLQKDARDLRLLTSRDEKRDIIMGLGVDQVEILPFTREFSRLSTEEYLRDIVIGRFGADAILLGYDNRMGFDSGSPDQIASIAEGLGLEVIRMDAVSIEGGQTVSSTKIRTALAEGDVELAAQMLGRRYSLFGVTVAGNRLGRTIGFPTANMKLYEPLKLLPADGCYLVEVETLGRRYYGMTNIGHRPTVSGGIGDACHRTVETNIFDFNEDIYGLDLTVSFISQIREEKHFPSLDALRRQLESDRDWCIAKIKE